VGYGDGALAFLDSNGKKMGEIALDAHPESFQLEKAGTRVFVNVPDRKEIQVADLVKNAVLATWSVTSALKNYPMALRGTFRICPRACQKTARQEQRCLATRTLVASRPFRRRAKSGSQTV
jgi:hypothetical protein